MKLESLIIQSGDNEKIEKFLKEQMDTDRPLVSGLARYGVSDGRLYTIVPSNESEGKTEEAVE